MKCCSKLSPDIALTCCCTCLSGLPLANKKILFRKRSLIPRALSIINSAVILNHATTIFIMTRTSICTGNECARIPRRTNMYLFLNFLSWNLNDDGYMGNILKLEFSTEYSSLRLCGCRQAKFDWPYDFKLFYKKIKQHHLFSTKANPH